jgi:hypothetical protein
MVESAESAETAENTAFISSEHICFKILKRKDLSKTERPLRPHVSSTMPQKNGLLKKAEQQIEL